MSSPAFQDILIAESRTAADWWAFRKDLSDEGKWQDAFELYFRRRLELRYLGPIAILQEHGSFQGEGFSIASIQCALIEFLAATRWGLNYKRKKPGPFEYSKSGELFVRFLSTVAPFNGTFDEALASDFYTNVRCGLLHEASTKEGWRIWAEGDSVVDAARKIVFRNPMQRAISDYVDQYGMDLVRDGELQAAFLRKFDHLASP